MNEFNRSNPITHNLSRDAHIGHHKVKNNSRFDNTGWPVGSKQYPGLFRHRDYCRFACRSFGWQ